MVLLRHRPVKSMFRIVYLGEMMDVVIPVESHLIAYRCKVLHLEYPDLVGVVFRTCTNCSLFEF